MILHLVNQSPLQSQALQLCLRFVAEQDSILLLADAVIAASNSCQAASTLHICRPQRIMALHDDVLSHGLSEQLASGIELIDYDQFVALCCSCSKVQSWF